MSFGGFLSVSYVSHAVCCQVVWLCSACSIQASAALVQQACTGLGTFLTLFRQACNLQLMRTVLKDDKLYLVLHRLEIRSKHSSA